MSDVHLTSEEPKVESGSEDANGKKADVIPKDEDMSSSNVDSKKEDDTVIKEEQTEESKGEKNLTDSTLTKKEEPSGLKQEIAGIEDKEEKKAIEVVDLDLIKDEVMSPKIEKMEEDVNVQITGTPLSGDDEIKVGVKSEKKKKDKKSKKERKKEKKERKKARKEAKKKEKTGITGIGERTGEQEKEEKYKGRENKR